MTETPATVVAWANEAFGMSASFPSIAARANKEMSELLSQLTEEGLTEKTGKEVADVIIVLWVLCGRAGIDIQTEIDGKMAINRKRRWVVTNGHGQHVEDGQ